MKRLAIINSHLNSQTEICIVAAGRSPIQKAGGEFKSLSTTDLAGQTISGTLKKYQIDPSHIQEFYMGCVNSTNLGQNPARQAAIKAGLEDKTNCISINKLCASAMKALSLGCLSIQSSNTDCVLVGGSESMSNYPYLLSLRNGISNKVRDSLEHDTLQDAVIKENAIKVADHVSSYLKLSKVELDSYAVTSCDLAFSSSEKGKFADEIIPINLPKTNKSVTKDALKSSKTIKSLNPIYKTGTTSSGNACGLNDGASCIVLCSRAKAQKEHWKVLGTIKSFADAEQESRMFPLSPSLAINKALKISGIDLSQVDFMELNEPFSCVVLGNAKILKYPVEKINVYGGALALGHPVGSSGCRIVITLLSILKQEKGQFGVAGICNGAGGATAVVIKIEG